MESTRREELQPGPMGAGCEEREAELLPGGWAGLHHEDREQVVLRTQLNMHVLAGSCFDLWNM